MRHLNGFSDGINSKRESTVSCRGEIIRYFMRCTYLHLIAIQGHQAKQRQRKKGHDEPGYSYFYSHSNRLYILCQIILYCSSYSSY